MAAPLDTTAELEQPWFLAATDLDPAELVIASADIRPTINAIVSGRHGFDGTRVAGIARYSCLRFAEVTEQDMARVPEEEEFNGDLKLARILRKTANPDITNPWLDLTEELTTIKAKTPIIVSEKIAGTKALYPETALAHIVVQLRVAAWLGKSQKIFDKLR